MIGIALVSFNGTLNLNFKAIGIIISILCAVLWGVYTVVVELINRYKLKKKIGKFAAKHFKYKNL